jgi:heme-degrading monooxygenase HmoA
LVWRHTDAAARRGDEEVLMHARVPTFKLTTEKIDDSVRHFQEKSLIALREIPGFKGGTILVDREKGILRIVVFWEDREALDSSFEPTKRLRAEYTEKFGAELVSLEEFEVAGQF